MVQEVARRFMPMKETHAKKHEYSKPKLVDYGDIRAITRNIGTHGGDSVPAAHSR